MTLISDTNQSPQPLPPPLSWQSQPVVLPSSPGVYWFIDENNHVLYVGKAKNLNNRLRSYTRFNQLNTKTKQLVSEAWGVKYQELESEFQSLLVEAELIRLHQPHYNILLKDDKSPLYIIITKETYPRVLSVRKSDLHLYETQREFGPFPSGYQVRQVLTLARKIFPFCTANQQEKGHKRACFYYHLHLCPGACVGKVTLDAYRASIKSLELFLQGKHKETVKQLTQEIQQLVATQDFESAGIIKRKIDAINYVNQRHKDRLGDEPLPNVTNNSGHHRLIELRRLLEKGGIKIRHLSRIETYDVATIQGQAATVSMVVALEGTPDSSLYRHFHIKTLNKPNDVGMLKEALTRRQNHPEWGNPDLIVMDGGITQVKAAQSIIPAHTPVIGLAKDPDRLVFYVNGKAATYRLNPTNPGSQLVIKLHNEAHRFARRLHHKTTLKQLLD